MPTDRYRRRGIGSPRRVLQPTQEGPGGDPRRPGGDSLLRHIGPWQRERLADGRDKRILVSTKCDEPAASALPVETICTSTVTGDIVSSTASRCRESIHQARSALDRAKTVHHAALGEEIVAAELRVALDELGKVVGTVYTDDVLDRVFRRFCVGK